MSGIVDCLVLGDSIAVGVAQQRPECVAYATGGLNTWQWNKKYDNKELNARTVIISLGTNDHSGVNTYKELSGLRADIPQHSKVFWIMPPCNDKFCKQSVNDVVAILAKNYGDIVLTTKRLQADAIHPSTAGYKELAKKTK